MLRPARLTQCLGTGVAAGDGGLIQLTGSDVTSNQLAFSAAGTGQIQGWPANTLGPNVTTRFVPGTLPVVAARPVRR